MSAKIRTCKHTLLVKEIFEESAHINLIVFYFIRRIPLFSQYPSTSSNKYYSIAIYVDPQINIPSLDIVSCILLVMGKWEFAMFEQSPDLCFWVIATRRKPSKQEIALCKTIRPEPKHSCGQFAKNKYKYWTVSKYYYTCLTYMEDFIPFISTNNVKQPCTITLWPPACSRNQRCHHPTGCSLQSCAPPPPAHCVLLSVVRAPGSRIPRSFPPCAPE